jgi:hypothetical protein
MPQPQYGPPPAHHRPTPGQYAPAQHAPAQYGPAPVQYGRPAPPPEIQCRLCGNVPAAKATFRAHRGMVVIMQFRHLQGPFCRDCGLATFRKMTADTLIQGWYGYLSFVITPITVLINLARRGTVANLPAPRPPAYGPSRRPLDPGDPLLARPAALIGLAIPVVLLMALVFLVVAANA